MHPGKERIGDYCQREDIKRLALELMWCTDIQLINWIAASAGLGSLQKFYLRADPQFFAPTLPSS